MTRETARTISQLCLIGGILIILATCGICCTGKTTYGPEEFYDRGDGTIGYGAKSYSSNTDALALMLFVGGPICIVLFLVSAGFSAHAEKMPSSADLQGIPPTDESPIRKQVKVENEHAKYESDYLDYLPGAKDPLFGEALAQIIVDERAAIVRLQRELRIGYGRAAAIIEAMRSEGFIGDLDLATRSYPVLPKAYEGLKHLGFADEAPADEKR